MARAAPLIPHFKTKINIGAMIIFAPTVNNAEIIAFLGYPVALMILLSPINT